MYFLLFSSPLQKTTIAPRIIAPGLVVAVEEEEEQEEMVTRMRIRMTENERTRIRNRTEEAVVEVLADITTEIRQRTTTPPVRRADRQHIAPHPRRRPRGRPEE